MAETKTYAGSCHCGKVRFEVDTDLGRVLECNCSLCGKAGWLLTFVMGDRFRLLSGEDCLTDYQFAKKKLHHPFCRECGVHPFGHGATPDGKEMRAINLRCLEGLDVGTLTPTKFDGKSL